MSLYQFTHTYVIDTEGSKMVVLKEDLSQGLHEQQIPFWITQDDLPDDIKIVKKESTGETGFYVLANDKFIPVVSKSGKFKINIA